MVQERKSPQLLRFTEVTQTSKSYRLSRLCLAQRLVCVICSWGNSSGGTRTDSARSEDSGSSGTFWKFYFPFIFQLFATTIPLEEKRKNASFSFWKAAQQTETSRTEKNFMNCAHPSLAPRSCRVVLKHPPGDSFRSARMVRRDWGITLFFKKVLQRVFLFVRMNFVVGSHSFRSEMSICMAPVRPRTFIQRDPEVVKCRKGKN